MVTQDLSTVRLLEFGRFSRHLPLLTLSWIDPKAEFGLSPLARLVTRTTRLDIDYVDITHCGWNDILLGPRWPTVSMGTEFLEDKQSGLKWEYSVRLLSKRDPISALKPSNFEITYRIRWEITIVDNPAAKFFRDTRLSRRINEEIIEKLSRRHLEKT